MLVTCESRRKQRWVEPQSSIPPTPPRSPTIPELFVDDLLDLWSESQQTNTTRHDISFDSALSHLSNDDDEEDQQQQLSSTDVCIKEERMEATENEDEDLIRHLLSYVSEDSPPPTNPPSPPEFEQEPDLPTGSSINFDHQIFLNQHNVEMSINNNTNYSNHDHNNNSSCSSSSSSSSSHYNNNVIKTNNHHINTTTTTCSSNQHHSQQQDDDDTDVEMEEFNRYPKTEPITEEFTTHIFDNFFNLITDEDQETEPIRIKTENDITEIKHDCMWAGSCESDSHQDMYEELFGPSTYSAFDFNTLDVDSDSSADPLRLTPDLDEDEEEDDEHTTTLLRNVALSDHSYAFNGIGPIQQHPSASQQPLQSTAAQQQSFSSSLSCSSSSSSAKHAIQGIVIKEEISEESSTRKTKILVPLKDLMETLQQKSFLVAPLGPGKKVIRLTGNGETVKGVLDFGGAQFKSSTVSCSSLTASSSSSVSSFTTSTSLAGQCSPSVLSSAGKVGPRKPPSKKMKKAIHKPKQELSPSSPVHSSSLISSSSHCGSNNLGNNSSNGKPKKAKTHNNMERMRRIDLRNSFDTLKKLVPSLNKATKCSKVEILKKSSEYINTVLKATEKRLLREEHNLKVKNESLRSRAAYLASNN